MTGTVSLVTDDGGEILSNTSAQCLYTFDRNQFVGDYELLKIDVHAGTTVHVVYQTKPGNVAKVVRRLQ